MFKRYLKFSRLLALAIGGTISSTYFLGNGFLYHQLGPFAFLTYIFGALITFFVMMALSELTSYHYLQKTSFIGFSSQYLSKPIAAGVGFTYWINWILYIPTECISAGFLLNAMIPEIPISVFALLVAAFISFLHLKSINWMASASEGFTYIHVFIFLIFSILAALIFLGFSGNQPRFLGFDNLFSSGNIFPNGFKIFLINGVLMLLNYQGTEIVGLACPETVNPKEESIKTMKEITPVIGLLYVIPMFLLPLIFPWNNPPIDGSIFSIALESYGFKSIGMIFALLIAAGAISCVNSGLYAASRSLYSLSHLGLFLKKYEKINKAGIPSGSVLLTAICFWSVLILVLFFPNANFFKNLLALSGFSGTFAWISICISHYRFRTNLTKQELNNLPIRSWGFPYSSLMTAISLLLLMLCIGLDNGLRGSLYFGVVFFMIPTLWIYFRNKCIKV